MVWQDVCACVSSAEQLQHFAAWLTSRKHQVVRLHLEEFQSPNRRVAWLQWREHPLRLVAGALRRGVVLALRITSNVERKKSKKLGLFHGRDIRLPQLQELCLCVPGLEVSWHHFTEPVLVHTLQRQALLRCAAAFCYTVSSVFTGSPAAVLLRSAAVRWSWILRT